MLEPSPKSSREPCTEYPWHVHGQIRPFSIQINFYLTGQNLSPLFYRPQTKLQKGNVFTSVCQELCPRRGGGKCTPPPPWANTPLGRHPPPGQTPPADGYCSGRYTSYWNAFLLHFSFKLGIFHFLVYYLHRLVAPWPWILHSAPLLMSDTNRSFAHTPVFESHGTMATGKFVG